MRKIAFVDRDGCLIEEPADEQVDSLEKLRLMPDVVPALLRLRDAGYELVIVSNQDGLGTDSFPTEDFERVQNAMRELFASQGIRFSAEHFDPHFPEDNAPTRKPGIGMVLDYLKGGQLDFERSCMIGDRETDLQLADNMGIRGFRVGPQGLGWMEIAAELIDAPRKAFVTRNTNETKIEVAVNLDASGPVSIATGHGFFDHMLEQIARHGGFAMSLVCQGDLHVDEHHTVEDCALALGEALRKALGDKRGIGRYGFIVPMDETQAQAAVDLSGRPALRFEAEFPRTEVGGLSTEMVEHFFRSLADSLRAAVQVKVEGENTHHMVEGAFKAVARCLRQAIARQGSEMPSTKGVL
jgi:imidazoleglycerol-phosphate dehydratase/histidinol-phosphatase